MLIYWINVVRQQIKILKQFRVPLGHDNNNKLMILARAYKQSGYVYISFIFIQRFSGVLNFIQFVRSRYIQIAIKYHESKAQELVTSSKE